MEVKDVLLRPTIKVPQKKANYSSQERIQHILTLQKAEKSVNGTINMNLILINILKFIVAFGL